MRNGARRGKVGTVGSQDELCWDSTHASSRANDLGEKIVWCTLVVFAVDPKLTFWLPVFTKVSYGTCNRRKGYYTDGARFAKWLWSLMIMHLPMVIGGGGGRGWVNPPWGHMWAGSTGFVDICCQFLAHDGRLDCLRHRRSKPSV